LSENPSVAGVDREDGVSPLFSGDCGSLLGDDRSEPIDSAVQLDLGDSGRVVRLAPKIIDARCRGNLNYILFSHEFEQRVLAMVVPGFVPRPGNDNATVCHRCAQGVDGPRLTLSTGLGAFHVKHDVIGQAHTGIGPSAGGIDPDSQIPCLRVLPVDYKRRSVPFNLVRTGFGLEDVMTATTRQA